MVKLQGTAPNQVPTNADLGSLAYVDHDNVNLTAADLRLKALSKTKSQTAADVFVYDTSKDSDGGAWRHRTQHTSWYNEGASNTRGSRKEFPAVAVIVAESNKVTIYDGDDPSLPMWMVFGSSSLWVSNLKAVSFRSGILLGGVTGSGLRKVDFLQDTVGRYFTTGFGVWSINVSGRGTPLNFTTTDATAAIVNANVNDVAMTVLPDAPTDLATGLPVPTIAVATDGGVSVIKDSGDVWDSAATGKFEALAITDGQLYARDTSFADDVVWYGGLSDISADGFVALQSHWTGTVFGMKLNSDIGTPLAAWGSYSLAVATSSGLNSVAQTDATSGDDRLNGMVAYTTSSYNTGWMNGDIKGAFLSSTDTASLVGTPYLDDDFTSYADETAFLAAGYQYNGVEASFNAATDAVDWSGAGVSSLELAGAINTSMANGTFLHVQVTVSNYTTGTLNLQNNYVTEALVNGGGIEANGTFDYLVTKNGLLRFTSNGTFDGSIDNITIRLADEDRSVNNNGLAVHGSITKAAVATGADVVAYSGFSNSNYLEQPYNSDLDFGAYTGTAGTGDFCIMGWMKTTTTSFDSILHRSLAGNNGGILIQVNNAGLLRFFGTASTSYANILTSNTAINTGSWVFFSLVRDSGTLSMYLDGAVDVSTSNSTNLTYANTVTKIGGNNITAEYFNGSLALLRISGTAPTADQIKKIYNDEKVLFQESAKATLTGSSDAVTALAHDPDTDLLHVGTSGGRSVFQGLRRVEEHTGTDSQSLAAISAVDGLVVEGK